MKKLEAEAAYAIESAADFFENLVGSTIKPDNESKKTLIKTASYHISELKRIAGGKPKTQPAWIAGSLAVAKNEPLIWKTSEPEKTVAIPPKRWKLLVALAKAYPSHESQERIATEIGSPTGNGCEAAINLLVSRTRPLIKDFAKIRSIKGFGYGLEPNDG